MNLIDPSLRAGYEQAFVDLHDTFSNDIVVWKSAQEVVLSTDPNFNGFYPGQPSDAVQVIPQSGVFRARIKWLNAQQILEEIGLQERDQQKIDINLGGIRIRVSGDALPWIQASERITFNNEAHRVIQRDRPHGLFDPKFFDFILQRIP